LSGKLIQLIDTVSKVVQPIFDAIRNAGNAINKASKFSLLMSKLKILGALAIIGAVTSLVANIKGVAKGILKQDKDLQIEKGLEIVENASEFCSVGETIVLGIKEFGVVAATETLKTAASALLGVGAILSAATIALHAKHWYDSAQFRKRLVEKFGGTDGKEANLKDLVAFTNEQKNRTLKNRFGVNDSNELKLRLNAIYEKSKNCTPLESKKIADKTMTAMKKRLFTKELFHSLKIIASVISIIASAVLLFTPLAPLGFALLAVSSAIVIGVLVADYIMSSQFQKSLNEIVPISLEEIPKMPVKPELKDPKDLEKKAKYDEAMKKYNKDLVAHYEGLAKYYENLEYASPIKDHKWAKTGKQDWKKKVASIGHWELTKAKSVEGAGTKIQKKPIEIINSEIVSHFFSQKAPKISQIELAKIEQKNPGMTFEEIKNWKPKRRPPAKTT
jgi:hypothetical protein